MNTQVFKHWTVCFPNAASKRWGDNRCQITTGHPGNWVGAMDQALYYLRRSETRQESSCLGSAAPTESAASWQLWIWKSSWQVPLGRRTKVPLICAPEWSAALGEQGLGVVWSRETKAPFLWQFQKMPRTEENTQNELIKCKCEAVPIRSLPYISLIRIVISSNQK